MRGKLLRGATAASVAMTVLLGLGVPAGAAPPPPADLRVEGGEEAWHPKRRFRIVWRNPVLEPGLDIAAAHYRVLNPAGAVAIPPTRLAWPASSIERLEVPAAPGAYTAEISLEDSSGDIGAPAAAKLRFDNARPGTVEPVANASWIGRTAFPLTVRLSHPAGDLPVSGIRGYAVSVAPPPGRHPCQASDRCSSAETDLSGGVANDAYRIADLPEGMHYVQAVAVSGSGMTSTTPGRAVLRVDKTSPIVALTGAPAGWVNHSVLLNAIATDDGSGMTAAHGIAPFTAIAVDGGTPKVAPGSIVSASVIDEGVHRVAYYARDLAGNVEDDGASNGVVNGGPPIALVRIDRQPPSVSFANSQDSSDPELIRARIGDAMSGPHPSRGWIGVRSAGSGDRFVPLPPAPRVRIGELRARWDSDAYPAGEYEFRAVAYDAAGNVSASTQRADGKPMRLPNPLKTATVLRAGLAGQSPARQVVPYGHRFLLKGRLTTEANTPLSGMPVKIVERSPSGRGAPVRVSTVTTMRGGAFAIRLSPGPSRQIAARFEGTPTLARSATPSLRLAVRSSVNLLASARVARVGGPPIAFKGRVGAAPGTMPPDGKAVQLQFRLPGLPWSEFRTVQTDRRGRFGYAYRFSDDDSRGAVFQFRAYVPAQADWPYEPGGSRPVAVRGR
ncbi:MAG TPA: hypothetical protein VFT10_03475 [Solirubrobacterales bacterium]|nr:hypothetical protein [Solirubrobacterales bacterium]